jgi:hypothetical protein
MPSKMVLYYNLVNAGFSETFYHPNNDPVALSASIPNNFYQAMVNFRATSTFLKAARFSSTLPPRQSYLARAYPVAKGYSQSTADPGPDVASTTAVFVLGGGAGKQRRVFMRGLADVDVKRDIFGNDTPSPALVGGSNQMFQQLALYGFSIRTSDRPPNAGLIWYKIFSVQVNTDNPDSWSTITNNSAIQTFQVGDRVQFNGVEGDLRHFPHRTQIIGAVLAAGIWNYVIEYPLPGGVRINPKNLQMTKESFSYNAIVTWAFERFSEHRTGRPFGSLVGRKKAG